MRRILGAVLAGLLLCSCAARKEQPVQTEQNTETLTEATIASRSEEMTEPEQEAYFAHSMLLEPKDTDFVRIRDYIPDVIVELKYAGQDNFTGQTIYEFEDAFLRYGSVMKLREVCRELREMGYRLKIWDGFRPVGAQFRLWEVCPDPNFVANPNVGFSNHSRGNALDITLVGAADAELVMPSGFDDFSARADRDYSDCTPEAADNARLWNPSWKSMAFPAIGESGGITPIPKNTRWKPALTRRRYPHNALQQVRRFIQCPPGKQARS